MFCRGCGKGVDTSATTCPHCGRDVDALSGGTGFWDLMWGVPDQQAHLSSLAQTAHVSVEEAQREAGGIASVERSAIKEEIPQQTRDPAFTEQRPNPTKRRAAAPRRISSFAIGIGAVVCVLIMAVVLVLVQCSHAGDGVGGFDDNSSASTSEGDSNDADEESERGSDLRDADGNSVSVSEGNQNGDNQMTADSGSSSTSESESTQGIERQGNVQEQKEGTTKNGQ